jgi:uncharacterized cysteine cluster protein YcgN (CxxCxxCC family)
MQAPDLKSIPYWETKTLEEMSPEEWESLCAGCGACCVQKLEDARTGQIYVTDVACRMLDTERCRCRDYAGRTNRVTACVRLTPTMVRSVSWLPSLCAYRRLAEGRRLPWWHPLVCGNPQAVHHSGASVRGRVVSESSVPAEQLDRHILGALV